MELKNIKCRKEKNLKRGKVKIMKNTNVKNKLNKIEIIKIAENPCGCTHTHTHTQGFVI